MAMGGGRRVNSLPAHLLEIAWQMLSPNGAKCKLYLYVCVCEREIEREIERALERISLKTCTFSASFINSLASFSSSGQVISAVIYTLPPKAACIMLWVKCSPVNIVNGLSLHSLSVRVAWKKCRQIV